MPFSEHSHWFTYGKSINKKGDWEFDKNRIKHELEKNLYDVRFCPSINFEFIQDIIAEAVNSVEVLLNGDVASFYCSDSDFAGFLTQFLDGKPLWLS